MIFSLLDIVYLLFTNANVEDLAILEDNACRDTLTLISHLEEIQTVLQRKSF